MALRVPERCKFYLYIPGEKQKNTKTGAEKENKKEIIKISRWQGGVELL